jgi:GNAT superfamily N-acetyltransferase
MQIIQAITPQLIERWMRVPELIYKEDKNWIPHLRQDIEKIFDPKKNKLFKDGKAVQFVLMDGDRAVGRIGAFVARKYAVSQKQPTGGCGFFECIPSKEGAFLLLDAAQQWLKDQGMEAMDGPINFGEKDAFWGLLVENFTDMSSYRMNYNPPYYRAFFEDFGFRCYYEQWCYKRDLYLPAQEIFVKKNNILMTDTTYRVTNARGMSDEKMAQDFVTIYNAAWAGHLGFKTMDIRQARNIVKSMKPVMDRDIMVFAYHGDRPIGFYLSLPELNEIFRHVHGNLNTWGKVKFLYYKFFGKREVMVGIIFGIDREYHGKGVEGALIKFTEDHIVSFAPL